MANDAAERNGSFQLILDTTEQLIREKGCRQTTLQDIIDRSGLSKGAIYHYVSGKDELLGRILKSKVAAVNEQFREAVRKASDQDAVLPIQTITRGIFANTDRQEVSSNIFTYLLSQTDNPKVASIMKEVYDFSLQMAVNWIETGKQAGAIPEFVDAELAAAFFLTFSYGLRVQQAIAKDSPGTLNEEDIFRFMLRSLQ